MASIFLVLVLSAMDHRSAVHSCDLFSADSGLTLLKWSRISKDTDFTVRIYPGAWTGRWLSLSGS